jgi:hypothetical protein
MAMPVRGLLIPFCLVALSAWTTSVQADPLAPADAASHVGEVATVCGFVASAKYAPQAIGAPTFLDFGKAYPNAVFTALILGDDRTKFGAPETTLGGKEVCVRGEIRLYRGRPQLILTEPEQLDASAHAGP